MKVCVCVYIYIYIYIYNLQFFLFESEIEIVFINFPLGWWLFFTPPPPQTNLVLLEEKTPVPTHKGDYRNWFHSPNEFFMLWIWHLQEEKHEIRQCYLSKWNTQPANIYTWFTQWMHWQNYRVVVAEYIDHNFKTTINVIYFLNILINFFMLLTRW